MCAEQIPADSVLCPYCGTRFGKDGQVTPLPAEPVQAVLSAPLPVGAKPACQKACYPLARQVSPAQHRLHLTAFGAEMRRLFGRKVVFRVSCLAQIGGR